MIEIRDFTFPSQADGLMIAGIAAIPDVSFVGIIQLVHGMAEHKERYLDVMKYFAAKGYLCILHDHRGHGGSVKDKADLGFFNDERATYLIADIHQLTLSIRKEYPSLPIILFGHSMGSLLVRAYCKCHDDDIDALIVCGSPSENPAAKAGVALVRVMKRMKGAHYRSALIQRLAFGSHNKSFNGHRSGHEWLCSDPAIVDAYDKDPLCGFTFTLNGFENMFTLMRMVYDRRNWQMKHRQLPVLFLAGGDDPCIIHADKYKKAYRMMQEVGYQDVEAKLYAGKRHEILNETGKTAIYQDIAQWLNQHHLQGVDRDVS